MSLTPELAFAWWITPLPYATPQSIFFGRLSRIGRSRLYAFCVASCVSWLEEELARLTVRVDVGMWNRE